ncbi:MAG: response regulator [Lawsonibacter sp.]|nr:response regulator [Lawsonibacter sp.]
MYEAIIVEDDPMVSALNRRFVEKDSRFHVAAEFLSGKGALRWLLTHPVDLVLLDVYMPVLPGTELLREMRARGIEADAIMVTAAHDTQTLNELLKLGIVDYLVKPFAQLRFQQALDTFCRNRATLAGSEPVSQSEIDRLLYTKPVEVNLPKGLQVTTMEKIRNVLQETEGETTCEVLASGTGLSAVTVRRYLTYLLENGEAESSINYDTGGRPSVSYSLSGKEEN